MKKSPSLFLLLLLLFSPLALALTEIHYSGALQGHTPIDDEYDRYNYSTIGGEIEIRTYTQALFSAGEYWSVGLYKTNPWSLLQENKLRYNAESDCIERKVNSSFWRCYWSNLNGLKWSNPTGHLVKVVKLPNEVRNDNREKTTPIQS